MVAVILLQFEERLLVGDDVPAVPVDEDDAREAVRDEARREVFEQVEEVQPRRGGEGAGKVHVVVRVTEPLERREQALGGDRRELHALG